jgi:hypothetical protein
MNQGTRSSSRSECDMCWLTSIPVTICFAFNWDPFHGYMSDIWHVRIHLRGCMSCIPLQPSPWLKLWLRFSSQIIPLASVPGGNVTSRCFQVEVRGGWTRRVFLHLIFVILSINVTFTFYYLLFVDMFWPHTAISRCYSYASFLPMPRCQPCASHVLLLMVCLLSVSVC